MSEPFLSLAASVQKMQKPSDESASNSSAILARGILELFKPAVEELDSKVDLVRQSQIELREQIDTLAENLYKLAEVQEIPIDLDPYVKKLMNSRRRIMLVNNILQNAQDRLGKLHQNVTKESAKRKAQLHSVSSKSS